MFLFVSVALRETGGGNGCVGGVVGMGCLHQLLSSPLSAEVHLRKR